VAMKGNPQWATCARSSALYEDHLSKDQRHHRDEQRQRYTCVDGEHHHRRSVRFEHDQQGDTNAALGQAHIEGYF
jgi:hypothetical protein